MSNSESAYCVCPDTDLEQHGARKEGNTYICSTCNREIAIARIWGLEPSRSGDSVTFQKRSEALGTAKSKSNPTDAGWPSHAKRAFSSAKAVEAYVTTVSFLTYFACGILAIAGLSNENLVLVLAAIVLAAMQFVWAASIRMVTAYIMFKSNHALESSTA